MSLWVSLNTAFSGLQAAQAGIGVTSQNVANAKTDGYMKKVATFSAEPFGGVSRPVIERRVNDDLMRQAMRENSSLSQVSTRSDYLNQLLSTLGTPANGGGLLTSKLSDLSQAIENVATSPAAGYTLDIVRDKALTLTDEFNETNQTLQELRQRTDEDIGSSITDINKLLVSIEKLNKDIARYSATGQQTAEMQNQRDTAIQRLSEYMPIRTHAGSNDTVSVYMAEGPVLVDAVARQFNAYSPAGVVSAASAPENFSKISFTDNPDTDLSWRFSTGKLGALVTLRDGTLPQYQSQLDNLAAQMTTKLNEAHNQGAVLPPRTDITGSRDFGADSQTWINFSGPVQLMTVDGTGAATPIPAATYTGPMTLAALVTDMNTRVQSAFGALASVTLSNGTSGNMVIKLPSGATSTLAFYEASPVSITTKVGPVLATAETIPDPELGTPTPETINGFSNYFGLNDLFVLNSASTQYQTATLPSPHSTPSNGVKVKIYDANFALGSSTISNTGTLTDIVDKLNGTLLPGNALPAGYSAHLYRDGDSYGIRFSGPDNAVFENAGGLSIDKHIVGGAEGFDVRSDIQTNPSLISKGRITPTTVPVGGFTLDEGDRSTAADMAAAFQETNKFLASGETGSIQGSFSSFLSKTMGKISSDTATADSDLADQKAVSDAVNTKISEFSGVSIDEEMSDLIRLQNAYGASARVMTTVNQMLESLMSIGR